MSFLKDYQIVTQNNECPASYHLFSALVALSSIVSGKVWLDLGMFCIRPNLYVILTGAPGVKKTTAMMIAKQLLFELGDSVPMSAECQTKEALTQSMSSKSKVCVAKPNQIPRKFKPVDEEQSKFLYCPMSIFVTEFSQFVGSANAGHMLDFLTTIYDEHHYKSETKGKGVDLIPMPYLTLLGCTVPDWITARLKEDVITGGFSRRAIFVYETHTDLRIPIPFVTPEMDAAWSRLVITARKLQAIKGPFEWGPGAKDYYCDWYINLKRPEDPLLDGWFNSIQIQMLKVAMLISASEWDFTSQHTININHMQMSMEILSVVEANIPKVFQGVGRNELAGVSNKLIEMLRIAPGSALPERLVKKDLFKEVPRVEDLSKMIQHLIATRQIKKEPRQHPVTKQTEIFLVKL